MYDLKNTVTTKATLGYIRCRVLSETNCLDENRHQLIATSSSQSDASVSVLTADMCHHSNCSNDSMDYENEQNCANIIVIFNVIILVICVQITVCIHSIKKKNKIKASFFANLHASLAAQSHQQCVNSQWLRQWEPSIFDPHRINVP